MYTSVTIKITKALFEHARRLARQRNQDVAEVLVESIRLEDVEDGLYPGFAEGETAVMAREEKAFHELHPQLQEKYPREYVAIFEGQLIDHDSDLAKVLKRTKQKHPDKFVWIAPVQATPEEVFHFRSPRLVG